MRHERAGARYVYHPASKPEHVRRSALRHLVSTFFEDSPSQVVAALIDLSDPRLSASDLDRLGAMIEDERRRRDEA